MSRLRIYHEHQLDRNRPLENLSPNPGPGTSRGSRGFPGITAGASLVRYRGLQKNPHRLLVTAALANLHAARGDL